MGAAASGAALGLAHLTALAGINSISYEDLLGQALWGHRGADAWWSGLWSWLALGALIGFAYSFVLRSAHRSGAGVGINVSFFHLILGIVAMAILSGDLIAWDFSSAVVFALMHPVFGAVFGILFDRAAARTDYPKPIVSNGWR